MAFHVSRQCQYPDGEWVVEICTGGADYANPCQLGTKYRGEGEEYDDPREAVDVAIRIAQEWQNNLKAFAKAKKKKVEPVFIGHGNTGGMTMPFDGMELTESTFAELKEWAEKKWEKIPKCGGCGCVVNKDGRNTCWEFHDPDTLYCDNQCLGNWLDQCRADDFDDADLVEVAE